jgi:predicted Zn-dependent peptidase
MPKFNRTILENGLIIIHEKRDVPVTTVMMGVKYGSMYESEEEKGIAHFMEHLCFKGTEKRNAEEIAKELENKGGDLNAFTHEEITAYHVRLPSRHLELAIDVIGDIFFNPIFPEEDVEREGNVICEEIKMYEDNPRAHAMNIIKNNLYEKPFGGFIAGTQETVKSMNRDQLLTKHRAVYIPKNSVLCVVGDNSFEDVIKFASKFVMIKRDGEELGGLDIRKNIEKSKENRDNLMQTNLCLGVHFPNLKNKDRYSAEIFSTILGEGMSSRLFKEVREKRGLVYGVRSSLDLGRNYGYMVLWAGCDSKNREEVIRICKEEFAKMKDLTEEELNEAKETVIGRDVLHSEASNDIAVQLIMEEFATKAESVYDFEKKVNSVKLSDVCRLAEDASWAEFFIGP